MIFNIDTTTEDEEIIKCARHMYAWLKSNNKLDKEDDISLLALANSEIRQYKTK